MANEGGALETFFGSLATGLDESRTAGREAQQTVLERLLSSGEFDVIPRADALETDISLPSLPKHSLRRRDEDPEIAGIDRLKSLIDFGELISRQTEEGTFFKKKKTLGDADLIQQVLGEIVAQFTGDESKSLPSTKGDKGKTKAKASSKSLIEALPEIIANFNPILAAARASKKRGTTALPTPSQVQAPTTTAKPGEPTKGLSTSEQDEFLQLFNGLTPNQQEAALEDPDIRKAFQEAQAVNSP